MTGGLPGVLRIWPAGTSPEDFLAAECSDPASALWGVPEAALQAEFPAPDMTRRVIEAIGGGDRTHTSIAAEAGSRAEGLPSGVLSPILRRLVGEKHVLAAAAPLSVRSGKPMLYRVADSSLRFYLAVGRDAQERARRGRPRMGMEIIRRRWPSWRGRAVEPLIRQALLRAADELPWPELGAVGGWWNRSFQPEIDLVGADREPVARTICFAGSVKWLNRPFNGGDLAGLLAGAVEIPGYRPGTTQLAAVSRSGAEDQVTSQLAVMWGPDEVVAAFEA